MSNAMTACGLKSLEGAMRHDPANAAVVIGDHADKPVDDQHEERHVDSIGGAASGAASMA